MTKIQTAIPFCYQQQRTVSFADTDMGGIVHFPNYLKYVEDAEYAFLDSIGLSAILEDDRGKYGFPRTHVECRYHAPAQYGDGLDIDLACSIEKGRTLIYRFQITRQTHLIASGSIETACCRFPVTELPYAIPLPDRVIEKLVQAGGVLQN
ncbi:MAG: thioesterase family protein [Planctomycetota bacterium]|nr:thioesterase family protein [Planctomycetota bacterium]